MISVANVGGVWRRSSIVLPDGTSDTTTRVLWLQTDRHFVDLRQPADRPDFSGMTGFGDLSPDQAAWLARQEGFAGELVADGDCVEWRRWLDIQPPSGRPDSARLWFEGATLVEEGRHAPYVERWEPLHARPPVVSASAWARVGDRRAMIVRSDDYFMIMVGGVDAAHDALAREISFGLVRPDGWVIEHSTLPWREGSTMKPGTADGVWRRGSTSLPDPTWNIEEQIGDLAALGLG